MLNDNPISDELWPARLIAIVVGIIVFVCIMAGIGFSSSGGEVFSTTVNIPGRGLTFVWEIWIALVLFKAIFDALFFGLMHFGRLVLWTAILANLSMLSLISLVATCEEYLPQTNHDLNKLGWIFVLIAAILCQVACYRISLQDTPHKDGWRRSWLIGFVLVLVSTWISLCLMSASFTQLARFKFSHPDIVFWLNQHYVVIRQLCRLILAVIIGLSVYFPMRQRVSTSASVRSSPAAEQPGC